MEPTEEEVMAQAAEIAALHDGMRAGGFDPKDFLVQFDMDCNTVTVTNIRNGISKTYARSGHAH